MCNVVVSMTQRPNDPTTQLKLPNRSLGRLNKYITHRTTAISHSTLKITEKPLSLPKPGRNCRCDPLGFMGADAMTRPNAALYRAAQVKFFASSVLPFPLYFATCGYGHRGRVIAVLPAVAERDATI
jgi:hypothetical protein